MMQMLKERWQHFSQRERIIVAAGGTLVAATLAFLLIIDPLMATIDNLDRQTRGKRKTARSLRSSRRNTWSSRRVLPSSNNACRSRRPSFHCWRSWRKRRRRRRFVIASPACSRRLPSSFRAIRRPPSTFGSTGVSLPQILALLVAIEQAPYDVQVHHLQLKPKYDNPVNLDATLRIVTYAKV